MIWLWVVACGDDSSEGPGASSGSESLLSDDDTGHHGTQTDPCVVSVSAALIVTDDHFSKDDGLTAFVCRNQTLSHLGDNGIIFVESNGQLALSGEGNTVYAAAGADVSVYGMNNTFVVDPTADLRDDSGDVDPDITTCDPLAFTDKPAC